MQNLQRWGSFVVGQNIKHEGDTFTVLEIKNIADSDMGCGPVFEIYYITLRDTLTGENLEIKIED